MPDSNAMSAHTLQTIYTLNANFPTDRTKGFFVIIIP